MSEPTHDDARRLENASALDMVDFAAALARTEPDRRSMSFPLAGGHAVLTGNGMFVNVALAAGITRPPTADELQQLVEASAAIEVPATIEVSELSHPATVHVLRASGFVPAEDGKIAGLVRSLTDIDEEAALSLDITMVDDEALLLAWQETAAIGWGHTDPDRRAASDSFASAASATQTPGLLLARDSLDQRIVGCASLSVRDGVAILGGMSTVPSERNRGVQHALIHHRLAMAAETGCAMAGTQADPDGGSIRNLVRCGFTHIHTKVAWVRN